jgi:hypothetical protein
MDHDALVDQPAHPPIQQTPPTTLNHPPAQPSPPINQQVLNKTQSNYVAMPTQQFGQSTSQFAQQNPLAAGTIGAGIMAKRAMQNNRQ